MLDDYERAPAPPIISLLGVCIRTPICPYTMKLGGMRQNAEMKVTRREWLNYFRPFAQYQYGRIVQFASTETIDDPLSFTSLGSNQHSYSVGISLSIPLGDVFSRDRKYGQRRPVSVNWIMNMRYPLKNVS